MKIYVTVKQAGRRKQYITRQEMELKPHPASLRDVITQLVQMNVEEYNQKVLDKQFLQFLLPDDIDRQAATGKVGFGEVRNENQADANKAVAAAILAFQDGIFRVFVNDEEVTDLDAPLVLSEESIFTFVRFTMLSGRMW